jgi:hypothetical protein
MEQTPGPYDSPQYSGDSQVEPNPGPVKTIGILNIVFACGLLLCVSCYGIYTLMFAAMNPAMQAAQVQAMAERQERIDKLKEELANSNDATRRAELQGQIDALENTPMQPMPDTTKMSGLSDPMVLGFYIADAASGLILNLVMLIVGIGLVGVREWGRQGGTILSIVKIVRLVVLYGVGIAVIAPVQGGLIADGLVEMMKQMPNRQAVQPPAQQLGTAYTMMLTGYFVAIMILGAIYPAISAWVLTREGAKAATRRPVA